ncbi:MAG TPA: hypothetical protein VJR04_06915 [Terriglobales bacterium]|nr:hypothetical protein [Terriglobales bacterium]
MSVESLKGLFDSFAVGLLFLTFTAGLGALLTGNVINKRQSERLRQFDKDLTDAKTELGRQQERAANAEKSLLELQQKLANRTLTDEQVKAIRHDVERFAGQEFRFSTYWDSPECVGIAERVNRTLQAAGWKYRPYTEYRVPVGGTVGILVYTHPNADKRTNEAATALLTTLSREGLQAQARMDDTNAAEQNIITLVIGSKR